MRREKKHILSFRGKLYIGGENWNHINFFLEGEGLYRAHILRGGRLTQIRFNGGKVFSGGGGGLLQCFNTFT